MKVKFLSRWCKYRDANVGDVLDMDDADARDGIERGILEVTELPVFDVQSNSDSWAEEPAETKKRGGRKPKS